MDFDSGNAFEKHDPGIFEPAVAHPPGLRRRVAGELAQGELDAVPAVELGAGARFVAEHRVEAAPAEHREHGEDRERDEHFNQREAARDPSPQAYRVRDGKLEYAGLVLLEDVARLEMDEEKTFVKVSLVLSSGERVWRVVLP